MNTFELWFIIILLVIITVDGIKDNYSPHIECIENASEVIVFLYYNIKTENGYKRKSLKLFKYKK